MRLEPSSQNAMVLHDMIAYDHEYNGFGNEREEGERIADVLGDKQILLLANHGVVATGESVSEAYYRLYFLERAATTQMIAMAAGKRKLISEAVLDKSRSILQAWKTEFRADVDLYFEAVKRVLNAQGSDYAS